MADGITMKYKKQHKTRAWATHVTPMVEQCLLMAMHQGEAKPDFIRTAMNNEAKKRARNNSAIKNRMREVMG